MILGRTEMVPLTSRATEDCSHVFEIHPSRVAKQVIGPRFPRSWLDRLSDWNLVNGEYCGRKLRFGRLP